MKWLSIPFIAAFALWVFHYVRREMIEAEIAKKLQGCKKCKINLRLRGPWRFRPCIEHKPVVEGITKHA